METVFEQEGLTITFLAGERDSYELTLAENAPYGWLFAKPPSTRSRGGCGSFVQVLPGETQVLEIQKGYRGGIAVPYSPTEIPNWQPAQEWLQQQNCWSPLVSSPVKGWVNASAQEAIP